MVTIITSTSYVVMLLVIYVLFLSSVAVRFNLPLLDSYQRLQQEEDASVCGHVYIPFKIEF